MHKISNTIYENQLTNYILFLISPCFFAVRNYIWRLNVIEYIEFDSTRDRGRGCSRTFLAF